MSRDRSWLERRRRELHDELESLGDTRPERRRWLLKCIRVADKQLADWTLFETERSAAQ